MARTLQACLPRSFAWSACREIRRRIPAAARQAAAGARGSMDDASRPLGGNVRVHGAGGASAPGHCMVAGMMPTLGCLRHRCDNRAATMDLPRIGLPELAFLLVAILVLWSVLRPRGPFSN